MHDYIGSRLKASDKFLKAEIARMQEAREALVAAWEKWDLDELERMGYITASERNALEKEWDENIANGLLSE